MEYSAAMRPGDHSKLLEFISPYAEPVQRIMLESRLKLWDMLAPVNEIFWDATQTVCSGFTYTEKTSDCFVNLAIYANHVTLIFLWGVKLNDPEGRLRGEGSRVRNYRLVDASTLDDPYIVDLIQQASDTAKRPAKPMEPITIVKVMNGPKKRPTR